MRRQAEEHTHPLEAHQDGEDGESDEDGEPDEDGEDGGDVMIKIMGISLLILQMLISLTFLQKSIFFFARNRTWSEKDTEHYKNILETFVNIQRVPGIMHA